MDHEDGYCDGCGCELVLVAQLTVDGRELCSTCVDREPRPQVAKRPEVRDDGR